MNKLMHKAESFFIAAVCGLSSFTSPFWRNSYITVEASLIKHNINEQEISSDMSTDIGMYCTDYSKATSILIDTNAISEAKSLMGYLKSIYGSHIISGQQERYGGGVMELEFEWIQENTGKQPAIRGFDFMNYNPLYGWEDGTTERIIDWVNSRNGIATASWHINVPIDFENYELGDAVDWIGCTYKNYQASNGTFNTANAIVEGTKEYEYFQMAMENLAEQLLILQKNNVPVIFRPLHEAQGSTGDCDGSSAWYWWGDKGSEVYKELWKLLYITLTEQYGVHNLIWEYNSYDYANSSEWYPGDEYVDLVSYDKYNVYYNRDDGLTSGPNVSAISSKYDYLVELTDGRKMVAMSENDTVPTVENLTTSNAGWLYFCTWYDDFLMSETYNDSAILSETYNSEYCITLDELPTDWKSNYSDSHDNTATTTTTTTTSTTTTTTASTTTTTTTTEPTTTTTTSTTTTTTTTEPTTTTTTSTTTTTTTTEPTTTTTTTTEYAVSGEVFGISYSLKECDDRTAVVSIVGENAETTLDQEKWEIISLQFNTNADYDAVSIVFDNVKINSNAFSSDKSGLLDKVTSIVFDNITETPGGLAFKDYTNIKEITIPVTLQSINTSCFKQVVSINLKYNDNIYRIAGEELEITDELIEAVEAMKLETVGSYAFYNCPKLKSYIFPEGAALNERAIGLMPADGLLTTSEYMVDSLHIYGWSGSSAEMYIQALSDESKYIFTAVGISSGIKGDVNEDGIIDIADATATLTIYAKKAAGIPIDEYTDRQINNADMDSNGTVDIGDATEILTYYARNAAGL